MDTKDAMAAIESMKSCTDAWWDQTFDIHGEAHEAIEFLRRHLFPSSDLSIENLKFIFAEITERFGGTINCCRISLMSKTGYEVWLVDLDGEKAAWFKGESYKNYSDAFHLAVLNLMNFKIPDIDASKNSLLKDTDIFRLKKTILYALDMKLSFVEERTDDYEENYDGISEPTDDEEEQTDDDEEQTDDDDGERTGYKIQITCTLYNENDYDNMIYTGESTTNRLSKKANKNWRKEAIREAREKAQDEAEKQFFWDVFDNEGPNEFTVDELGRPVKEQTDDEEEQTDDEEEQTDDEEEQTDDEEEQTEQD